ncbi:hypothetical protein L249_5708 [Ophiocordyceps polyrhachis-furcata BCC 54312]|uniref:Heterokaryon incompatibility domain-containing protein n=1 Tax=Ophiocordyceps polyrhachis-furcata BCC 54312 TaxID=1330021 RepID=A0A367L0N7_9HYPO|nr:hypothetical protein L249_5708 [Ophiocordyceps polyrhachis-furcata BCC 54312]
MTPRMDHRRCSFKICRAFQIEMSTYRPLHVQGACEGDCWTVDVDVVCVQSILRSTNSFPIMRLRWPVEERDELKLTIEPFQTGTSFAALSHVWADGLGNPQANSLPRCQVQRMARKIAALPDQSHGWFWVDTLCCPIEPETKTIALQRMADVYRHARHVLVLDSSLSAVNAEDTHPAELLFRVFGCSPWMRRLWTLQGTLITIAEGALAGSLQIQFADGAVGMMELLIKLSVAKDQDMRYERLNQSLCDDGHREACSARPPTTRSWESTSKVASWTETERTAYQRQQDNPLCRAIDAGDCGLVWSAASTDDSPRMCCMVRFLNGTGGKDGIARVRRERIVILAALGKTEIRVMDNMQLLADEVAEDCTMQELIRSNQLELARERIKRKLLTAWESEPCLKAALKETLGDDLEEETVWAMVPKLFSHYIVVVPLGEQLWAVD